MVIVLSWLKEMYLGSSMNYKMGAELLFMEEAETTFFLSFYVMKADV